ncbi:MAG: hypothetical protein A2Z64_10445 [Betaproteobacteria bacterium RIFCSPLOWO2_02_67_12]|nr:MAG: hypothetical protein A2Z64_10445 [Betaproteobacteria bacterium RIFCSPLOWO2_02_67_12]OGA30951.1 MAG: hypothetical protein A3I65_01645 [Betaproteobacteria bacterium RIFCSPLOWO2_02_FULL_68_150]OGA64240.1 MAG: hypothetical protein A3F77_15120 [Betaproteobacteria bacterium RIFCSPLOWO2_12_FULL_67_28]
MGYAYLAITLLLTVAGQLLIKWRVVAYGALPEALPAQAGFVLRLLLDPYILAGLGAAFAAALAWMAALTQLELSRAYPLMSLSFALVLVLSAWLLGEQLSLHKAAGVALIVLGAVVIGYGR